MGQYENAKIAADFLSGKVKKIPSVALVLGSGMDGFSDAVKSECVIPYEEIPGFPAATATGHRGKLVFGSAAGKQIALFVGRWHPYEGYSTADVTFYIRVLSLLGVKTLILTNATGAINLSFSAGDLMLITDHISFMCESPLFGKNEDRFGTRYPSMTQAYDREYLDLSRRVAGKVGVPLREGVYAYTKGPMFETPAEIRALRAMGADACGMSTVAETIVAVHCGMRVLAISCLSNMAAGILDAPLTQEEVIEAGNAVREKFKKLMIGILTEI